MSAHLQPGEQPITVSVPVKLGEEQFGACVTSIRLLLQRSEGIFFKNDHVVSFGRTHVVRFQLRDTGLIFKTGLLSVTTAGETIELTGDLGCTRCLHDGMLQWSVAKGPRNNRRSNLDGHASFRGYIA